MNYSLFVWIVVSVALSMLILGWAFHEPVIAPAQAQASWLERLKRNEILYKIAQCESGLKETAYLAKDSDGEPKYGLLQFDADTFISWTTQMNKTGYQKWDIWSAEDQVAVAEWAQRKGYLYHWGCAHKLGFIHR